jgi:phospholipid/cholesterol/gamma-HCH transport system substrate-binding protein
MASQATRSEKMKLGIFMVSTTILTIVIFIYFIGSSILESQDTYTIHYEESIAGLNEGASVRLRGVQVGRVEDIRIDPENVERIEVIVALEPDTPIKTDTRAVVAGQGMTGIKYVDLRGGSAAAERLPPGSTIESQESLMGQLTDSARDISLKTYKIVDNVAKLTEAENREHIERILANADELVKNISELSVEISKTLRVLRRVTVETEPALVQTIRNVGEASERFDSVLIRANRTIGRVESELDRAQLAELVNGLNETNSVVRARLEDLDLTGTVEQLSVTLTSVQRLLAQVVLTMSQNQDQVRATLFNLRRTTDNLKDLSRTLRNDPSKLIFSDKPQERETPE